MSETTQEMGTIMAMTVVIPIPWIHSVLLLEPPGDHGNGLALDNNAKRFQRQNL